MLIFPSTNIMAPFPQSLVGSHFVDLGDAVDVCLCFLLITQLQIYRLLAHAQFKKFSMYKKKLLLFYQ